MELDFDRCWQAVESGDPRFDGWIFCGVTSTGIYCRPSCPARTPKRENVRFFSTAAAAQAAGFRTCKRCRPDATPGSPEWDRRADLVGRAMRLIADGVVDREGVAGLARRLAYSERQLHRQLTAVVGELRRLARGRDGRERDGGLVLRLPYRAPFDGVGLIEFLGLRAVAGVEEVVDGAYRRSLRLPHGPGVVELRPLDGHVQAHFRLVDLRDLAAAVQRCRALLDLDSDPLAVSDVLGRDPLLAPLVRAAPGRRVAGHVDGDELAVRAVLGQQVSLAGAATLAARLVADYGEPLDHPVGGVTHVFPSPAALADADPDRLAMPAARRGALLGLARALASGELTLDAGAEHAETERRLLALPGIGPWTVSYVAMRALRDPDAFLPSDLGVRHALERLGRDGRPPAATRLAERWRPYRAYAMQHLWSSLAATTDLTDRVIQPVQQAQRLAA